MKMMHNYVFWKKINFQQVLFGNGLSKKKKDIVELDFDSTLLQLVRAKHYSEMVYELHLKATCIPGRNF